MPSSTKPWAAVSAVVVFFSFIFFISAPFLYPSPPPPTPGISRGPFRAPKENVWADLSERETDELVKYLYSREELNLTHSKRATSNDNALVLLEVLQPNKTDVLGYLNGTAGPPPRWARVLIVQGATDEAFAVDYMVGPLPPGPATAIVPLDFCYNSGRNYVRSYLPTFADLVFWGGSVGEGVADITQALLDGEVNLLDPDSLEIIPRASHRQNATTVYWMQFYRQARQSDGPTLLPQGLYFKVEAPPTRDFQNWKVVQWYYNGVCYDTASDLRAAIKSPSFQKSPPNIDGDWTDVEDFEEGPPGREKPPPMTVQPQGGRYSIDKDQKFVSWMGFEFYITTSPVTGVTLYDITFGGERIIYELGLQEAMVHYAGDDPQQGGLDFLDTFFGMGRSMFELVPSYDCPAYATYLSTSYNDGDASLTNHNSICVFEYTADHALQRHTSGKRVSISRNTYLVVRSVSTISNYDYTIEYVFYLDGTIEVKVRASGYIFAAFWTPNSTQNEDEYGYRVHDAAATSIHDHVLNFKADIDVAGTANTLVRIGIEPVSKEYAWDDEYSTPRNTMHLVEHVVEEETGLNWPSNSHDMFVVQNDEMTNAWGEKRGYRITPGTGMGTPSHLTILNSTTLGKSAEWAYQDLWAVRQKDAEPKSANPLNWLDPLDPITDFSKFVDGERIVQEDLVIYFNLGSHHVPHSNDIPNTLMHTSASSVMFTPFNFHDRDPSRHSVQSVRLEMRRGGPPQPEWQPRYFGGRYEKDVHLKATDIESDLTEFSAPEFRATDWSWNRSLLAP